VGDHPAILHNGSLHHLFRQIGQDAQRRDPVSRFFVFRSRSMDVLYNIIVLGRKLSDREFQPIDKSVLSEGFHPSGIRAFRFDRFFHRINAFGGCDDVLQHPSYLGIDFLAGSGDPAVVVGSWTWNAVGGTECQV
jgi:hypothetical protein